MYHEGGSEGVMAKDEFRLLYFALRAFGLLITFSLNIKYQFQNKQKKTFYCYPLPLSFSVFFLLFHISFIHPISLPSSFNIPPAPFLPSFRTPFHMCSIVSLSLSPQGPNTPESPLSYTSHTSCCTLIL
jgi:hypothetical protein